MSNEPITEKNIVDLVKRLKQQRAIDMSPKLVFNKKEWLMNPWFIITEEQLDKADEKGFFGTYFGVDCFVTKLVNLV